MKDGWCDLQNNNAHCRWDDGDCCQSTTSHRMVRISPLCKPSELCSCRDPNAKENREDPRRNDDDDDDDDDDDRNKAEGSGSDEDRHLRTST